MVVEGRPMTAATTTGRTTGIWLDVPSKSGRHEIVRLSLERMAYADLGGSDFYEDVILAGQQTFVALDYEDDETLYATLYQIGPNGGLDWSECVAISGPEAA
jgi:hypothetical protein